MKMILVGALSFVVFFILVMLVYFLFATVVVIEKQPMPERYKAVFLFLAACLLMKRG